MLSIITVAATFLGLEPGVWVTIILAILAGVAALWKGMEAKIDTVEKKAISAADRAQLTALAKAVEVETRALSKAVEVANEAEKALEELRKRLLSLESVAVNREDFRQNNEHLARLVEGIALSLRESSATMTQRIDMVLFEVGRTREIGK